MTIQHSVAVELHKTSPNRASDDNCPIKALAKLECESLKAEATERLRHQVEFGQAVLRGLTLVNGGAIVSIFTFIGNTGATFDRSQVWWAFACFVLGLSSTILSGVAATLSQGRNMVSTHRLMSNVQQVIAGTDHTKDYEAPYRSALKWERGAIIAAASSFFWFVLGAALALDGVL